MPRKSERRSAAVLSSGYPLPRTYIVTLNDGTERRLVGTHLEQTAEGTTIYNERAAVATFKSQSTETFANLERRGLAQRDRLGSPSPGPRQEV